MSIIQAHRFILLAEPPSPAPLPSTTTSSSSSSSNPNFRTEYSSGASQDTPYPSSATFHGPYMGVVLVVLLVTFFLMAAFSVYVRRYAFALSADPGGITSERSRRPRGLDPTAIQGLPIVVFHCAKGESKKEEDLRSGNGKSNEGEEEDSSVHAHEWRCRPDCVVCLTDFQEAEKVRLLPKCEHCFHPECIDMWLFSHTTCPLCRRSLLPASTPPPPPPPPPAPSPLSISRTAS